MRVFRGDAPKDIDPRLTASTLTLTAPIATVDGNRNGRGSLGLIGQRLRGPAAALLQRKHPRAAGPVTMIGFPSLFHRWHDERLTGGLQIADDIDAVEASVEQEQVRADTGVCGTPQQPLEV